MRSYLFCLFAVVVFLRAIAAVYAQAPTIDPVLFHRQSAASGKHGALLSAVSWRNIAFGRGGRSAAVCGVKNNPKLYYMGATGGGVWRSLDSGGSWHNISDKWFGGSIGAIAVSDTDPNVLYVGGGESTLRGNVSFGYGVWKSTDAGRTWANIGLNDSRQIARIRIHPQNPDIVYVGVLGNAFAPHTQRGVFRSLDGGKTWQNVLYISPDVGIADLLLDPNNPRIIYATTWRVRRSPYSLESGGEGSGIWKSIDEGNSWQCLAYSPPPKAPQKPNTAPVPTNDTRPAPTILSMQKPMGNALTNNKALPNSIVTWQGIATGLPDAPLGISCVAVSPVNSDRVWAMVEAPSGGLYRSDNGGLSWKKINDDRSLRQRAWYFSRIIADPADADIVYVLNVYLHKSKDGGKTFSTIHTPHVDHHDIWINPNNAANIIVGDDGGAQISTDGGINWSSCENQATAQFYRISTDNHFPYRILTAQQDNAAIRISHRSDGNIQSRDWDDTAGGESGYIIADPTQPDIVYGGSYDGFLTRYDHRTEAYRAINVYPDNPMGHGAAALKYRFQWNFPLLFSPHDPKKLYAASNHLHVSYDEGHSWQVISPDLTRNDTSRMQASGGIITKDNTSVEYYCTIFAIAESPRIKEVLWAGSDDGLLHLSRNGGKTWQNVTPKDLPAWTMINSIEADPHHDGGIYIAATAYKSGNFTPYLYRSHDYGNTWTKITKGIATEHFTRVVRCDPTRAGLLYAGTESGMYVSFDDGLQWQSMQYNLPIVPVTDLAIKENHLIATTQGRSIWLIDHLNIVQQTQSQLNTQKLHLYTPANTYYGDQIALHYYLPPHTDTTQVFALSFWDTNDSLVRCYSNKPEQLKKQAKYAKTDIGKWHIADSTHLFRWNGNYPDSKRYDGMVLWWASLSGAQIIPNRYKALLCSPSDTASTYFDVLPDPRSDATPQDYAERLAFLHSINQKVSDAHNAIAQIRDLKKQLNQLKSKIPTDSTYKTISKLLHQTDSTANLIEEALHQPKSKSNQDPINFPIRLNNKLAHLNSLASMGNQKPSAAMWEVRRLLFDAIDQQLTAFAQLKAEHLTNLNRLIRESPLLFIQLKDD